MRLGKILTSNNADEFPYIRQQLFQRGVEWFERRIGCVITFWFYESEIPKLPTDDQGPYLPVHDDSGHSFYSVGSWLDENPGEDVSGNLQELPRTKEPQ